MNVHAMPEAHQGFALARLVLRSPDRQSREALVAACDVLDYSRDWPDTRLASEIRNIMLSDATSDLLPKHVPFVDLIGKPAHHCATLEAMNAAKNKADKAMDRRRASLILIAAAFGIAAVLAGAIAAKAHAIHTATIAQGAMQ